MKKEQEQQINKKSIVGVILFAGGLGLIGWGLWSGNFASTLSGCILTIIASPMCNQPGERMIVAGGAAILSFFIVFLYWYFWGFIGEQFQWAIAYCIIGAVIVVCAFIAHEKKDKQVDKKSIAGLIFFAGGFGLIGWGLWSGNFASTLSGCILTIIASPMCNQPGERMIVAGAMAFFSFFIVFFYWLFWGFIGDQLLWAIAYCVIGAIIIACDPTSQKKKNKQSNEVKLMVQEKLKNKLKELTAQGDWKSIAQEHGLDLAATEFVTRKEINLIPELLHADEYVIFFTSGFMSSDGEVTTNWGTSTWLSVLTNKRVLFLDSALLTDSLNQHSIPLKRVQAVSAHQGFFFGKVVIETGGKRTIIDNAWKSTVKKFAELANQLVQDIVDAEDAPAMSAESNLDKLKKLAELKEAGVLTEEEFTEQKEKLLKGI